MQPMRSRAMSLVAGLYLALLAAAATGAPPELGERLDEVFANARLASASVGVLVVATANGEVVYERDADRSLIPASTMKLLTATVALDLLKPDFRYTTELRADGEPDEHGWIVGDVYLRGSGDPTLGHGDLDDLAETLARRGITRITGGIVADDTCFAGPALGSGWAWDNETYAYSAQVSGLTVDGNAVVAEVRAGRETGAPCELVLDPPSGYLALARGCVTGGLECERPAVFRRRAQNVVATTGPVPLGKRVSAQVTLEGPALYAATLLQQSLGDRGTLVGGEPTRGATPQSAVLLAAHTSAPLSRILAMMNKPSDNNIAEALLRTLARGPDGPGAAENGAGIVRERLAAWGIETAPLRLRDGSGLSRHNLLNARAIVAVLRHAARDAELAAPIVDSLPVAGIDGTLRKRMQGTAAEGAIRAKTGSLLGVSALSGYVDGKQERILTFSFLVNNYTCSTSAVRGIQDRACEILAEDAAN